MASLKTPPILTIPQDINHLISTHLTNKHLKSLRLACTSLSESFPLRLTRVFISPSKINLSVFLGIASHPKYRLGILELIWDDAQWEHFYDEYKTSHESWETHSYSYIDTGFDKFQSQNFWIHSFNKNDMYPVDAFRIYQRLYREQQDIVKKGEDVESLKIGLKAFPNLTRVVITPQVYRSQALGDPDINWKEFGNYGRNEAQKLKSWWGKYETPLLRSLPKDFNYPVPRPWGKLVNWQSDWERHKDSWRGFNVLVDVIAGMDELNIEEFIVDVMGEETGISHRIFANSADNDKKVVEMENFKTICGRGLKKLNLAVRISTNSYESLTNGKLREALEAARGMASFALLTSFPTLDPYFSDVYVDTPNPEPPPLLDIIPLSVWVSLRSLSLAHIHVSADDFAESLKLLQTYMSLTLIDIEILHEGKTVFWRDFLIRLRDELGWKRNQPRITIGISRLKRRIKTWIADEIGDFLEGGENPFDSERGNEIAVDFGWNSNDFDNTHWCKNVRAEFNEEGELICNWQME